MYRIVLTGFLDRNHEAENFQVASVLQTLLHPSISDGFLVDLQDGDDTFALITSILSLTEPIKHYWII